VPIAACANSKECKPHKDHYDECALRVDEQIEKFGKPKEDCVEECMYPLFSSENLTMADWNAPSHSLRACPLRWRMRRAPAMEAIEVNDIDKTIQF
jgi:hypothetical protein